MADCERSIDNAVWTYQAALPWIASKKVTLIFAPASAADQQAVQAMIPKAHTDGTPVQESEIPTTFPHSISVKAQLRMDGSVVVEGGGFGMGDELVGRGGFTTPDLASVDLTDDDTLIAGQQSAIGIS